VPLHHKALGRVCLPQFPPTDPLQDQNHRFRTAGHHVLGRWIMAQQISSTLGFNIPHHLQKLWKEDKNQVLNLIIQGRPSLNRSLPGQSQSAQLCCGSLWNDYAQSMAQADDVRNDLGILPIRLPRRIALQLFHPFRVHGIDLNQLHRLLPQIMHQGFPISSCGLKTHTHARSPCHQELNGRFRPC
jgi:hypothetical protein